MLPQLAKGVERRDVERTKSKAKALLPFCCCVGFSPSFR
jgi:hypothetical protein